MGKSYCMVQYIVCIRVQTFCESLCFGHVVFLYELKAFCSFEQNKKKCIILFDATCQHLPSCSEELRWIIARNESLCPGIHLCLSDQNISLQRSITWI